MSDVWLGVGAKESLHKPGSITAPLPPLLVVWFAGHSKSWSLVFSPIKSPVQGLHEHIKRYSLLDSQHRIFGIPLNALFSPRRSEKRESCCNLKCWQAKECELLWSCGLWLWCPLSSSLWDSIVGLCPQSVWMWWPHFHLRMGTSLLESINIKRMKLTSI